MVEFRSREDQEHERIALLGQRLSEFKESAGFKEFKTLILDVIREDALKIFADVPADDTVSVIGCQQMVKVVDRIEDEVNGFIEEGRLHLDYLQDSNPKKDGD